MNSSNQNLKLTSVHDNQRSNNADDVTQNTALVNRNSNEKIKIVFYSHDTMGLGHIRRNILIAQALQFSTVPYDILLISGAKEAAEFVVPADTDRLILPSLYKNNDGVYRSRHLSLELNKIIELRSQIILSAVQAFEPDFMIVDNVARGACGELDRTLEHLQGSPTRLVLGMRDIKDEPLVVNQEWLKEDFVRYATHYYDALWVYGDRNVYDLTRAYSMSPELAAKVRFTGYFDHRTRMAFAEEQGLATRQLIADLHKTPYVLCMVGGGQDGLQLAEAFLKVKLDDGLHGILLTGPHMSRQDRCKLLELAAGSKQMQVIDFVSEPTLLLKDANAIVSMGGYNSVSEILSFKKRALIVPRVKPRQEQLIRAEELSKLGVVDHVTPDDLHPESLGTWIHDAIRAEDTPDNDIDMDGLKQIQSLLLSLLKQEKPKVARNQQVSPP
ncbi:MAG: glycosyltransferase [Gammaproteobacteria bacterium]|nr:glycosyltransferase [Gammaproteobacteria bacterium]MDH5799507.1 glycosyltransferase [Gammaproteobacteria bacterium]